MHRCACAEQLAGVLADIMREHMLAESKAPCNAEGHVLLSNAWSAGT